MAWVVPGYRSEVSGSENIAEAEVRKGILGAADCAREPRPVFDARFVFLGRRTEKSKGGASRFLVWKPSELTRLLEGLERADSESWIEIRNFQLRVVRVERTEHGATWDGEQLPFSELQRRSWSFLTES